MQFGNAGGGDCVTEALRLGGMRGRAHKDADGGDGGHGHWWAGCLWVEKAMVCPAALREPRSWGWGGCSTDVAWFNLIFGARAVSTDAEEAPTDLDFSIGYGLRELAQADGPLRRC